MKKKVMPLQILRVVVQIIAFLVVPALFITVFSSAGEIISALVNGKFSMSEYSGKVLLVLSLFIITAAAGRYFCGYICSFGAMQDLLAVIGKHIPFRLKISEKADRYLKFLKYAVLLFIAGGVWIMAFKPDAMWSPWTIFGLYSSPKSWTAIGYFFTVGGIIFLLIIAGSLFSERFFCKYLCPLGAIFAISSAARLNPVKRKADKCSGSCRLCTSVCPMSIPLYKYDEVSSGECINCMKCTEVCPNKNISADPVPAVSGTLAVTAVAGLYCAGTLSAVPQTDNSSSDDIITSITVEDTETKTEEKNSESGEKSSVPVTEDAHKPKRDTFTEAETETPDSAGTETDKGTESDTDNNSGVSQDSEQNSDDFNVSEDERYAEDASESQTDGSLADGVYTGSGNGFRGATEVSVTVENGKISDITIVSYKDDREFFVRAQSSVIADILKTQSIEVDTVSGATFSSNGIIEAVANALGIEFTNPNGSSGGHRRGR